MTLERYIIPLNSIRSYFNGGLSFVVFSIVEGNVNIFCGITRRYALIISLFSIKKKKLVEQDIIFVKDLLFELDTTNSFTIVSNKISKMNYLIWAGLRHSVPKHHSNCLCSEISLILTIDNKEFDILEKKSKDYYMLIKRIIAQCPKNSKHLRQDFNLTHSLRASSPIWAAPRSRVLARLSSLAQIGELARRLSNARPAEKSIPSSTYEVAFESYLKAFQYKVLN